MASPGGGGIINFITVFLVGALLAIIGLQAATFVRVGDLDGKCPETPTPSPHDGHDDHPTPSPQDHSSASPGRKIVGTVNPCAGMFAVTKNKDLVGELFKNRACVEEAVREQAGANVTLGYKGKYETQMTPITKRYFETNLCPVNVHWHIGAEHLSLGEYDDHGTTPAQAEVEHHRKLSARRLGPGAGRRGHLCHHYDPKDPRFTKPYEWKHCHKTMKVGQTYEIHWPHSSLGACHTPWQYQEPFYDGVFCGLLRGSGGGPATPVPGVADTVIPGLNFTSGSVAAYITQTVPGKPNSLNLAAQTAIAGNVGVQGQVFTIINDEDYYYPDLIKGMIVEGDMGKDITVYTGSTTGDSRSDTICSSYSPITWQVDRKCHLISASSFDKMCADMQQQADDMSKDLYAHGSRPTTADKITADNQQNGLTVPQFAANVPGNPLP